jgi:biotin-(acetyl-CoA carboxylase) ligase
LGRDVHVTTDSDVIEGRAEDVDGDGALLVRQTGGQLVRVSAGDVS